MILWSAFSYFSVSTVSEQLMLALVTAFVAILKYNCSPISNFDHLIAFNHFISLK